MELSNERIKGLMGQIFDKSYFSPNELKSVIVEESIADFIMRETNSSRVYTVVELQAMPMGTMFEHSLRGRCWISAKSDGKKCVHFQSGGTMNILQDGDPWNKPMRILYMPKG